MDITVQNVDDELVNLLQKRAQYYDRSLDEEVKEILRDVLTQTWPPPNNLAVSIRHLFEKFGDFQLPNIPR